MEGASGFASGSHQQWLARLKPVAWHNPKSAQKDMDKWHRWNLNTGAGSGAGKHVLAEEVLW